MKGHNYYNAFMFALSATGLVLSLALGIYILVLIYLAWYVETAYMFNKGKNVWTNLVRIEDR